MLSSWQTEMWSSPKDGKVVPGNLTKCFLAFHVSGFSEAGGQKSAVDAEAASEVGERFRWFGSIILFGTLSPCFQQVSYNLCLVSRCHFGGALLQRKVDWVEYVFVFGPCRYLLFGNLPAKDLRDGGRHIHRGITVCLQSRSRTSSRRCVRMKCRVSWLCISVIRGFSILFYNLESRKWPY